MPKPVVFLSFPDCTDLPYLKEERGKLRDTYRVNSNVEECCPEDTSLKALVREVNHYKDDITIFHFGGHAEVNNLKYDDSNAFTAGLAALLDRCEKLKLIVLNGCQTNGLVKQLANLNSKPVIIVTQVAIGDRAASQFAIAFHEQLCNQRATVEDAFAQAVKFTKLHGETVIYRSVGREELKEERELVENSYVLSAPQGRAAWKIPDYIGSDQLEYSPNIHLRRAVLKAMADHSEEVAGKRRTLIEEEAEEPLRENLVLKHLPYPVSEQLRKLFSVPPEGSDSRKFYHEPSGRRIDQYLVIYRTLLEFLTYSILADLYRQLSASDKELTEEERNDLRALFQAGGFGELPAFFYPHKIEILKACFARLDFSYFMKGFDHTEAFYNGREDSPETALGYAVDYLENLDTTKVYNDHEIAGICKIGEEMLTTVLCKTALITDFRFCSVRQIYVENAVHEGRTAFPHLTHVLIPNAKRIYKQRRINQEEYLENLCTYLRCEKENEGYTYLNLSPFYVDINSMVLKAQDKEDKLMPEIHIISPLDKESEPVFNYRNVYKPDEVASIYKSHIFYGEDYLYKDPEREELRERDIHTPYQFLKGQIFDRISKLTNENELL